MVAIVIIIIIIIVIIVIVFNVIVILTVITIFTFTIFTFTFFIFFVVFFIIELDAFVGSHGITRVIIIRCFFFHSTFIISYVIQCTCFRILSFVEDTLIA